MSSADPALTTGAAIADATITAAAVLNKDGASSRDAITKDLPLKEPPPEKPADIRRRTYVILSFWVIVLLLGLPIWWQTTTIYRAQLDQAEMLEWADGKACKPVFALPIAIQANQLQQREAQDLLRLSQHALDDLNDFSGHHLRLRMSAEASATNGTANTDEAALTIRLTSSETMSASLHPHDSILDITYPAQAAPTSGAASSALASYIATELRSAFAEEQAIISYMLSTSSFASEQDQQSIPAHWADTLAKRSTRSVRYAPTYHLTLSLFTDGPSPNSWDINSALEEYMRPVLDLLSPIHNFTVDTQVQLYAMPGVQSQILSKEDLSSFINAAEWPLSPSIGGAPTINFAVYVGNQTISMAPTYPEGETSGVEAVSETAHSWLIPQWGTMYLLGLPGNRSHVFKEDLKQPMLTFTSHLLSLLGTPTSGSLPLRLAALSRIRSADLLLRASSSLGSLARLSLALKAIAIPQSVAEGVAATLKHLRLACNSLGSPEGLTHARIAEEAAEKAFFEKSMVGQLYFPDEHKIAVYLPLLGPIAVPLVMGLRREWTLWRKRRREAAALGTENKAE